MYNGSMGEPRRKHEHTIVLIFASILVLALVWLVYSSFLRKTGATLKIGGAVFTAKIAKTDKDRAKGLGGTMYLAPDQAMLFIFPRADYWGIWMRDMHYPIDVLWLNEEHKIIHIEQMMQPGSYPSVFRPDTQAMYVVELPAASVRDHKIKVGQLIDIEM